MPQARNLPRKSAAAGRPGKSRQRATSDEPPERQPARPGRAPAPSTLRVGLPPDSRAASRPARFALDDRHQQMDVERLMGSAARDEVGFALAAFPGLAESP